MSNAKFNVSTASMFATAKHTHYAVSTAAAVVYALVWLLTNGAHAEGTRDQSVVRQTEYVMPAVVVTAYENLLPAVEVVAKRESVAVLDAVVVTAKRESGERVAAIPTGHAAPVATSTARVGHFAKVRNWFRATIAKVSG